MPSLDEVYRKFGEVSEAAQLLETALGDVLLESKIIDEDLYKNKNPELAFEIVNKINRATLGQLLRQAKNYNTPLDELEDILSGALKERNRLSHSFYREHNIRRNSEDGRKIMLVDLEVIHNIILSAFREVTLINTGIDIFGDHPDFEPPTGHLPI